MEVVNDEGFEAIFLEDIAKPLYRHNFVEV